MAQKVRVLLIDDVDGTDAEETVTFALDGVTYEIDLNAKNAGKLRDAFAPWVGSARRGGGRKIAGRRRSEENTSELQSRGQLGCRLLLEKNKYMQRQSMEN